MFSFRKKNKIAPEGQSNPKKEKIKETIDLPKVINTTNINDFLKGIYVYDDPEYEFVLLDEFGNQKIDNFGNPIKKGDLQWFKTDSITQAPMYDNYGKRIFHPAVIKDSNGKPTGKRYKQAQGIINKGSIVTRNISRGLFGRTISEYMAFIIFIVIIIITALLHAYAFPEIDPGAAAGMYIGVIILDGMFVYALHRFILEPMFGRTSNTLTFRQKQLLKKRQEEQNKKNKNQSDQSNEDNCWIMSNGEMVNISCKTLKEVNNAILEDKKKALIENMKNLQKIKSEEIKNTQKNDLQKQLTENLSTSILDSAVNNLRNLSEQKSDAQETKEFVSQVASELADTRREIAASQEKLSEITDTQKQLFEAFQAELYNKPKYMSLPPAGSFQDPNIIPSGYEIPRE